VQTTCGVRPYPIDYLLVDELCSDLDVVLLQELSIKSSFARNGPAEAMRKLAYPFDSGLAKTSVGAILSDLHDEWTVSDRRYLPEHTITSLTETCDTHPAAPDQLGTGWPPRESHPENPTLGGTRPEPSLWVGLEDRREGE